MESENIPETPAPRSPRDPRRFAKWEIAHRRVVGELQTRLRAEIEGLFVTPSLPSMYAIISAFRSYAQGVFDSNAEFLVEDCDTLSEYETRLEHEANGLQRVIGGDIHVSRDAEGLAAPEGGARLPGLYQRIIGDAVELRTCVRGATDYVRLEEFSETEHPRDYYLRKDISPHLQAFLQDRIHKWAAEFQSRRGPLVNMTAVDGKKSAVTGADRAEVKPSHAISPGASVEGRVTPEFDAGAGAGTLSFPRAEASIITKRAMIRNLPPASADKIRTRINGADAFLTQCIKWLPTELQDGKKTKQEVEAILCQTSKEWAWDVFVAILREWAEIGIPPDDFEATAKGQIESLSTHAEERVAGFVSGFHLSSGEVLRCVRDFLPGLIAPYREENRFRFHAVTAGRETAAPSDLATPQAGKPATRPEGGEPSRDAARTVDRVAQSDSTFPSRASWLRDRLLERGWSNSDPAEYDGPDRKTIQKILRGESVRNDVLQKLADALSQRHGKVNVLEIPQD